MHHTLQNLATGDLRPFAVPLNPDSNNATRNVSIDFDLKFGVLTEFIASSGKIGFQTYLSCFLPWVAKPQLRDNVVYWKTNGKINNDLQLNYLTNK